MTTVTRGVSGNTRWGSAAAADSATGGQRPTGSARLGEQRAHGLGVLAHRLLAVAAGLAPESAVHRDAEVVEVLPRGGVASPQPGDPVDRQHDAEEDAGVGGVEVA